MTQQTKIKIAFMGTPEIAAYILEALTSANFNISSVFTRPDKPTGRGQSISESAVKILAKKYGLKIFQPKNRAELIEMIKSTEPDLVVVAAFGMILPPEVFETPKYKAINVHPSLLPKYRGPAPVEGPILSGDDKTGVTIMQISVGMDEGDILAKKEIELTAKETAPELEKELADLGGKMIVDIIPKWIAGEIKPQKQDDAKATYTKLLKKEDGKIDWKNMTAEQIERMSRAYVPWPGVYTFWNGKKIDLFDIKVMNLPIGPGKVATHGDQILIGTKKGSVIPEYLKLEGKNKVAAADFLRGYPDFCNSDLN